jgi:hypothetical protein
MIMLVILVDKITTKIKKNKQKVLNQFKLKVYIKFPKEIVKFNNNRNKMTLKIMI